MVMIKKTKPRGRPVENVIPLIDAKPEDVAAAIMQSQPKKGWEYLKQKSG